MAAELVEDGMAADPLEQFRRWYAEAEAAGIRAPQAMALATAGADGAPSVRMVLLKNADEVGFVFFTGYGSRKGGELDTNPRAALLFHWDPLGRQVRVEGAVERVGADESDVYFATRPRGAQIAAIASRQGRALASRAQLDEAVVELERQLEGEEVRRPEHWGGYRVRPETYEFWQHRDNRLHDRLRYRRDGDAWRLQRLAPPHRCASASASAGESGTSSARTARPRCCWVRGPTTTPVTAGCASSHAKASSAGVTPRSSAAAAKRWRAANVSSVRSGS